MLQEGVLKAALEDLPENSMLSVLSQREVAVFRDTRQLMRALVQESFYKKVELCIRRLINSYRGAEGRGKFE